MKILIRLPEDRTKNGILEVFDNKNQRVYGPIACLGKGEYRDRSKLYGDTPTGRWTCKIGRKRNDINKFGQYPVIELTPLFKLKGERTGEFRIHSKGSGMTTELKTTQGCIRVSNKEHRELVAVIKKLQKRRDKSCLCLIKDVNMKFFERHPVPPLPGEKLKNETRRRTKKCGARCKYFEEYGYCDRLVYNPPCWQHRA